MIDALMPNKQIIMECWICKSKIIKNLLVYRAVFVLW